MRAKIMAAMAALAASLAMAAPAHAGTCGSAWQDWQCPPYSEFHATYGPNTTFLNLGNAENRATSYAYQELGHITEAWTGTAWSHRVSGAHVVAAIWVFNPSTRTAWRASYDVYGSNSFNQGVYGHVEWQQQY